jgi:hypothetical protein
MFSRRIETGDSRADMPEFTTTPGGATFMGSARDTILWAGLWAGLSLQRLAADEMFAPKALEEFVI